ncbi:MULTISPECIES: preprotein translocase subunit SecE [Chromohalobacter]|uniref:Protein translocase subunit SecE n=1 Tax=Chromohalobacter israelensis (strain ATCC BAA-138 / DSM 3043 / CIP 106854 / NCIMB 13768 / 1H11) TaxID=290398 RepID=Q1R0I8_CHRI1|nr:MULTISPECIES: preprotein translocase subunit SecE [Chromohalobacter]ABE57770.1 protein translocase subunit secE/sec61 gamma [Chromohalobacter salexigens DSM 3043]MBZ5877712.1 preprotein translocase subunit SecE [Chromohalobacter salexigens]MDF9435795.1 preprotein translocase subunit SecE [Chromohalobacter israelensis]MDO0947384.1 preprotein translocase subunit SecE [Chromohalobacter salexigens]NQY47442.1 preprotein translocase subunit SecE [Chromohalobacter sp.]
MKQSAEVQGSRYDVAKWALVVILVVLAVAGNAYFADQALLYRVLGVVALGVAAAAVALTTTKGRALAELARGSRKEIRRVVWPTRPETIQTTAIVLVAVLLVGIMLWLIDTLLGWIMSGIIG